MNKIVDAVANLDPVTLWIAAFIVVMVATGILSGYFRARKCQPNGFKWRRFGIEAIVVVISGFLSGFVLKGLAIALNWIHPTTFNTAPAAWWQIALEYVVFFFAFDTWFYWLHRWMHKEPMYKLIHKMHHWSTSPNVLTTFSVNPLESLINGGFMFIYYMLATVVLLPIHKETVPFIGATTILMGVYVHSGYEFLPRWWNKTWATKWFITTTFHDQHHKYFNYNFGGFTTIWDYLCGTVRKKYEADFDAIKARPIRKVQTEVEAAPAAAE